MVGRRKQKVKSNTSKTVNFDVVVIGGGSAGLSAAIAASKRGKRVVLIEKDKLGGECPNYACVPSKALITTAKAFYSAKFEFSTYGVLMNDVRFSFSQAMKYKKAVVDTITGNGQRLKKVLSEYGIEYMKGSAEFVDSCTVKVGKTKIKAKKIVIATGVTDAVPPIDGIDKVPYLTYKQVVSLKSQPKSVAIIGAGPVGVEFTTFFSMINTKVYLFEVGPQILGYEEEEMALLVQGDMKKREVSLFTSSKVLSVKKVGSKVEIVYQEGQKVRKKIIVDKIIIAAGKRSNVKSLKLEKAKVKVDDRGRIVLNKKLQSSQKHIFAAGDVSGGMQLTHTAHRDGEVVGWNVCVTDRKMKSIDNRVVPRVTFAHQEIASVGMTVKEAKSKKYKIEVRSFPVGALGRAVAENKRKGLIKVVLDKKTGKILGAHMVGEHAGDVIHELALAMHLNTTFDKVESMLHAFPTYSEAIDAI